MRKLSIIKRDLGMAIRRSEKSDWQKLITFVSFLLFVICVIDIVMAPAYPGDDAVLAQWCLRHEGGEGENCIAPPWLFFDTEQNHILFDWRNWLATCLFMSSITLILLVFCEIPHVDGNPVRPITAEQKIE